MARFVFSEGYQTYTQFVEQHSTMSDKDYQYVVKNIAQLLQTKKNAYPACGGQEMIELNIEHAEHQKQFIEVERQLKSWMKSDNDVKYHLARKVSCW